MFNWIKRFIGHLQTIRLCRIWQVDLWNWGLGFDLWYDAAPSFHFDSAGIEFRLGPLWFGAMLVDTN